MWISKKKFNVLEKRIADLERQVQSQQNVKILIDGESIYQRVSKNPKQATEKALLDAMNNHQRSSPLSVQV